MRPIVRIIAVVVIAGIACEFAFVLVQKGFTKFYENDYAQLTEIFENNTPYDILFVGSSRTHRHVYPKIIDSICGVNSFNAGLDAGKLADFELVLDGYLVHHPAPKVIVLTPDINSFSKMKVIRSFPQYFSFIDNREVCRILSQDEYYPYLKKAFPFLKLADVDDYTKENLIRLLRGNGEKDIPNGEQAYKGFLSFIGQLDSSAQANYSKKRIDLDIDAVEAFKRIVSVCKERGITLILTYSPEYNFYFQKRTSNSDSIFALINQVAVRNDIRYFRNDSLWICHNAAYFADRNHLNISGAMLYSAILADEIKSIIAQKPDSLRSTD